MREYSKAFTSFDKGPTGSGWSLSLVDKEGSGIGVKLNYKKIGWPNSKLYEEEMSINDLVRIRDFCNQAIAALANPKSGEV